MFAVAVVAACSGGHPSQSAREEIGTAIAALEARAQRHHEKQGEQSDLGRLAAEEELYQTEMSDLMSALDGAMTSMMECGAGLQEDEIVGIRQSESDTKGELARHLDRTKSAPDSESWNQEEETHDLSLESCWAGLDSANENMMNEGVGTCSMMMAEGE